MTRGPVILRIRDALDEPGDARFVGQGVNGSARMVAIEARCPGCGKIMVLSLTNAHDGRGFVWDGSVGAPTLSPKVEHPIDDGATGGCGWRGQLHAGVWMPDYAA